MKQPRYFSSNSRFTRIISLITAIIMVCIAIPNTLAFDSKNANQVKLKALEWIKASQNSDGSFGSYDAVKFKYTAEIISYMKRNNIYPDIISNAEQWALSQKPTNIDFKARLLDMVSDTAKKQELETTIINAQNADGGWGLDNRFESDSLDTSLVLKTLIRNNSTHSNAITKGLNFLISSQMQDGSWSYASGRNSDVLLTAEILLLLNDLAHSTGASSSNVLTAINKGVQYIKDLQKTGSNLDTTQENILSTLLAYRSILKNTGTFLINDLQQKIVELQKDNGSWYDNPYITLYAITCIDGDTTELKDEIKSIKILKKQKDPLNPMSFIDVEASEFKAFENISIETTCIIGDISKAKQCVYLKNPNNLVIELEQKSGKIEWNTGSNVPGKYTIVAQIKDIAKDVVISQMEKDFEVKTQFEIDGINLKLSSVNTWQGQAEEEITVTGTVLTQTNITDKVNVITNICNDKLGDISTKSTEVKCDTAKTTVEVARFTPKTNEQSNYTVTSKVYFNNELKGIDSTVFKVFPPLPPSRIDVKTSLEKDWLYPGKDELTATLSLNGIGTSTVATRPGIDMAIVLDVSGSMQGSPLEKEKEAAKKIVEIIQPGDRGAIISFSHYAELLQGFTNDIEKLTKGIDNNIAVGGTDIHLGIDKAIEEIKKSSADDRQKIVLLFSDGVSANSFAAMTKAKEAFGQNITIHTLGIGIGVDQELMRNIAKETGGIYRFSPTLDELEEVIMEVGGQVFNTSGKQVTLSVDIPKEFKKEQLEFKTAPIRMIDNADGSRAIEWDYTRIVMGQKKEVDIKFKGDSFVSDSIVELIKGGKLKYTDQNGMPMEVEIKGISVNATKYKLETNIELDKQTCTMNEDLGITISSKNMTTHPCTLSSNVDIYDIAGVNVASLGAKDAFEWKPLEEVKQQYVWNSGNSISGAYKVKVLWKEGEKTVAWSEKTFTIKPDGKIGNSVTTDKFKYNSGENVSIVENIYNTSKNDIGNLLEVWTNASDKAGKEVWKNKRLIKQLLPDEKETSKHSIATNGMDAGQYTVTSKVYETDKDGMIGKIICQAFAKFDMKSSQEEGAGLSGSLELSKTAIKTDEDINVQLKLTNNGNTDLEGLEKIVNVIAVKTEKYIGSYNDKVNIKKGQILTDSKDIKHSANENGDYLVQFLVKLPNGTIVPIDTKYIKIETKYSSSSTSAGSTSAVTIKDSSIAAGIVQDLAVSISADKAEYKEGDIIEYTVKYKNNVKVETSEFEIVAEIPEMTTLNDGNSAVVDGTKLKWKINKLAAEAKGEIKYRVKIGMISSKEQLIDNTAKIQSQTKLIGTDDDISKIQVIVRSDRYGALVHKPYIKGYPDKTFLPEKEITRAEAAAIFARIMELDISISNTSGYSDVDEKHWASAYIGVATKAGIFKGYGDNTFNPDAAITRAELTTVLFRYKKLPDIAPIQLHYKDIEKHWAKNYIEEIDRIKLISGYNDNTFKPDGKIKRSETVTMINRLLNRGPLLVEDASFKDVSMQHWAFGQIEEAAREHEAMVDGNGNEIPVKK